jgi:DNA-binding transcriptional regulator YdaS (Cro superfamily)
VAKLIIRAPSLLRAFLKRYSLSQADMARALGVSEATIHHWIHLTIPPGTESRVAIETWTDGVVKRTDWGPPKDRRRDKRQVVPHSGNSRSS